MQYPTVRSQVAGLYLYKIHARDTNMRVLVSSETAGTAAKLQSLERKQESSTEMPTLSPHVVSTRMLSGSFLYEDHFQPLVCILLL